MLVVGLIDPRVHCDARSSGRRTETFFNEAPSLDPNATKITGVICGVRIERIENPLMQKIRNMDKLVDELPQGRPMDKILRK